MQSEVRKNVQEDSFPRLLAPRLSVQTAGSEYMPTCRYAGIGIPHK